MPRRPDSPPTRFREATIAGTIVAALVVIGLAGCSRAVSQTGLGRLTADGQVQVIGSDGGSHAGHSGEVLNAGDRVHVVSGHATVRLQPSGVLELRAGSQVVVDQMLRLTAGAVLVQSSGGSLAVAADAATLVVPSGAAQLDVGGVAGLVAKVYQATSHLDVAGNAPVNIAAPRQINLTPGVSAPTQPSPLRYQDSDSWDRQYLSEAETISSQLGAAAIGFNAQVPANQGKDAAYYQHIVPTLNGRSDFVSAFEIVQRQQPVSPAPAARPGDYLVASVIALRGSRGTFESRLNDELVFSAEGAPWGFVAYDQGVTDLSGVLDDVVAAIGRATLPFTGPPSSSQIALGPPRTVAPPTTRPTIRQQPAVAPTTVPTPGRPRPPTITPTTTRPLIQLPVPVVPGPLGPILNPLLDPLIQALNNILAGRH
ncbi:MAG: hypothetical protein M3083_14490 [Actinomycetota bacterium]|nr:hypothetical protein [Actinomycetota bacterium]